jgi:hypothetical protein
MARIYAVANGDRPIQSPHFAERPLKELLDLLKISRSEKWSGSGPIIMEGSSDRAGFVQIEVAGHEGEGGLEGRLAFSSYVVERGKEPPDVDTPVSAAPARVFAHLGTTG